jgi:basic amino acid/polyamine antiporter, APA family
MFSRVHPTLRTPYLSQLLIGIIVACVAALTPIEVLGEMVSIGTLFAFVLVCGAVIYLRRSDADIARRSACRTCPGFGSSASSSASRPWSACHS